MMHDSAAARLAINLSASELSGDEQKCIQDALAFFECYPTDITQIRAVVQHAFSFDQSVLIEQGLVHKREISVAILETPPGTACIVSHLAEVCYASDFLSHKQKCFLENILSIHVPVQLAEPEIVQVQTLSLKIFRLLHGKGLSRIDFFYIPETKQFIFNEVNTLPGFTVHSLYPQLIQEMGIAYPDMLSCLIEFARDDWGVPKC